ncbi:hypothetical protein B4U79_16864 [Dinothrombium tinctorium]|uniref:Exonuclease domain-containing protein n=1 Tax=Dinothrombium tinctorium TaxID=1965070 RepID=A0A3S3RJ79_9ACAR|nr:hypothetical protein B4U79_16864 [Dinothrombium tinctorium]
MMMAEKNHSKNISNYSENDLINNLDSIFHALDSDKLKTLYNRIGRIIKNRKPRKTLNEVPKSPNPPTKRKAEKEERDSKSNKKLSANVIESSFGLTQPKPLPTPLNSPKPGLEHVVALDIESVVHKNRTGENRNVPALVAVVNWSGLIYYRKISWKSSEILSTVKFITGIDRRSLEFGAPESVVKVELSKLLETKKILVYNGNDTKFLYDEQLELNDWKFDVYDVGENFFDQFFNENGVFIKEKISLKRVVRYFYNVKIQEGVHNPIEDAYWTLKLYIDFCLKGKTGPFYNIPKIN